MSDTINLKLPYILPSQAQKHVTHNEALRMLDAIVQLAVLNRTTPLPPSDPAEGSRYIIPAQSGQAWSDQDNNIAAYIDGEWFFFAPQAGWQAYIIEEQIQLTFDGQTWQKPEISSAAMFGISTSADHINRFAVASDACLLTHAGAGHQLKLNKNASEHTASLLFQSNWRGFAEMGLAGEDNFSIKISDDNGQWRQVLRTDRATGNVAIGSVWPTTTLHVDGPIRPANYQLASLPSASSHGAGAVVFVENAGAFGLMAYSDGTVWRKIRDDTEIHA